MDKPTYAQYTYWKNYQQFLPETWQLSTLPEERFWSWQSHSIHLDVLEHPQARAIILLLHGGGGNGRILMRLAPQLHKMGYTVVAPDLPGYGLTQCPEHATPTYDQWAQCAADLAKMLKTQSHNPIITFGLSLGGFLAYLSATYTDAIAGVIATTLADTRQPDVWPTLARWPMLGRISRPVLLKKLKLLEKVRLPIRWLSPMDKITNNPKLSRVFAKDPHAGGTTINIGFISSLLHVHLPIEPESFARPVLCVHPTNDPWTPASISKPFYEQLGGPKQWVDLEGCGHFPYEQPGASIMFEALQKMIEETIIK